MSYKPRPTRPRHKPRPRARPRLIVPTPLPPSQASQVLARWAQPHMTMEDLLKVYTFPQVVRCRTPVLQRRSQNEGAPPVQLNCLMLLADQRTVRNLLARIVTFDGNTRSFNESADSVIIPEDYEGHFLRLQSRTTKDKTHVQTLEAISHDDIPAFLNLSDITSFPAGPRTPNDQSKFIYTVGNVFLVDEPLPSEQKRPEGDAQVQSAKAGSSRHKLETSSQSAHSGPNGLMRCLDERGLAVMVPTNQTGQMVAVQKGEGQQSKLSVKSCEMIANEQFPLLARYAYGKRRPRLTAFSKLLTLLDSFQETTIIGCAFHGPRAMLMEIPVTSSLHFQVALNRDELLQIPRMRKALEVCRTLGQDLARDIKFKWKFQHRVQAFNQSVRKVKGEAEGDDDDDGDIPASAADIARGRMMLTETYVYI